MLGLSRGDGIIPDHKNRNGLDNRKDNLHIANNSINGHNRRRQVNNTSGYRGVTWHKKDKKWRANIQVNGKTIYCGNYSDVLLAAKAYDSAAIRYFGENAVVNFDGQ